MPFVSWREPSQYSDYAIMEGLARTLIARVPLASEKMEWQVAQESIVPIEEYGRDLNLLFAFRLVGSASLVEHATWMQQASVPNSSYTLALRLSATDGEVQTLAIGASTPKDPALRKLWKLGRVIHDHLEKTNPDALWRGIDF